MSLPVQFINPFFAATQKICVETLKFPISAGTPRLLGKGERLWKLFETSASIQLSGAVRGIVSLSMSEAVAVALASSLAGEVFPNLSADARDALAEVANLVIGSAKRDLPGGLVTISTPALTPTQALRYPTDLPVLVLPFESPSGRFVLQIAARADVPIKAA